jgi:hypothetical protein
MEVANFWSKGRRSQHGVYLVPIFLLFKTTSDASFEQDYLAIAGVHVVHEDIHFLELKGGLDIERQYELRSYIDSYFQPWERSRQRHHTRDSP